SPAPAAAPTPAAAPARAAPAPCTRCGTVEAVTAVKVKGQGTGVGAVAGGVLGGVVGNQFGHGGGRTAMTVLGAVGGGFAGNEVEKHVRSETLFDVRVRMRDGTHRTFRQAQPPAVGTRVIVDGNRLRVAASDKD
ncbi:MAG TPA: glycine zipper 2TM domain-containing protein, partial [Burkholderiaceae bacterium]|nr:glycine zipper 2TM domain-containing protein [Burkholderiaceae bacterium]